MDKVDHTYRKRVNKLLLPNNDVADGKYIQTDTGNVNYRY
jgi:hypothetical protein